MQSRMNTAAAARRHDRRTVLVTGAALGIGREYARRFAADGARVVCADLESADETMRLVEAEGREALGIICDVSSPESVAELRNAVEQFGGADILVHNAGIYPMEPFAQITFASWRRVMSVNLDSLFLLCNAFVGHMTEQGWGRVIAISSGMFHSGSPGAMHYVASKGGVVGLVRSLAAEVGPLGVTVNAVSLGLTRSHGTESGPHEELGIFDMAILAQAIKRTRRPEDLAGMVSFLASEEAGFITGQTVLIDGGAARA
jgi:NAD(P)-dependent dehydrogenase (short-subunit alcohol dehydrogenase family)